MFDLFGTLYYCLKHEPQYFTFRYLKILNIKSFCESLVNALNESA